MQLCSASRTMRARCRPMRRVGAAAASSASLACSFELRCWTGISCCRLLQPTPYRTHARLSPTAGLDLEPSNKQLEDALTKARDELEKQKADGRIKFRKKAKVEEPAVGGGKLGAGKSKPTTLGDKLRAQQVLAYSDEED